MKNNIRQIEPNDYKTVRYICGALNTNLELSSLLNCDYYIENEADVCFVATDEFNNPCGCILGSKNFNFYKSKFNDYLKKIKKLSYQTYKEYSRLLQKIEDFSEDYPAHFVISILPAFQKQEIGKGLFNTLKTELKSFGIKGMYLVLDQEKNQDTIGFFERLGFEKHKKLTSKKYIYIYDI